MIDGSGTIFVYNNANTLLGAGSRKVSASPRGSPSGATISGWSIPRPTRSLSSPEAPRSARARSRHVELCTQQWQPERHRYCYRRLAPCGSSMTRWPPTKSSATRPAACSKVAGNLSTTNPSPTGITLDPTNINHLWVIDASTDKVYQYNGATGAPDWQSRASRDLCARGDKHEPTGYRRPDAPRPRSRLAPPPLTG